MISYQHAASAGEGPLPLLELEPLAMLRWMAAVCVCACVSATRPVAHVRQGVLRGTVMHSRGGRQVFAFLGVPYAQPPLGLLRFHEPLPGQAWEGERDSSVSGSPCMQSNYSARGEVIGSEDCLHLDIYTNKISNETLHPVLVYIHGGDFREGWSGQHQPHLLLDQDIVLVTVNYRLGAFGFLSLEDKDMPGNNGLKDQKLALEWVRDNIVQFSGDPGAVTLGGVGAGAASAHLHMLSPASTGLFHRAISQSGSAYCPWSVLPAGLAQTIGEKFAANLGCNHHQMNDTLDCLRSMPAYVLQDIAYGMHEWLTDPMVFGPTVEPALAEHPFLTKDPWLLGSDIPWMVGLTSTEGLSKALTFDLPKINDLNDNFEFYGPLTLRFTDTSENTVHTALTVKKYYFLDGDIKPDNKEGISNMYLDAWFLHPIKEALRRHKGHKYFYYVDLNEVANTQVLNNDLPYFFPSKPSILHHNGTEENWAVSQRLIEIFTNFVIFGKPRLEPAGISWNESSTDEYLHIVNNTLAMAKDLHRKRDEFWSQLEFREKYQSHQVKDEL